MKNRSKNQLVKVQEYRLKIGCKLAKIQPSLAVFFNFLLFEEDPLQNGNLDGHYQRHWYNHGSDHALHCRSYNTGFKYYNNRSNLINIYKSFRPYGCVLFISIRFKSGNP